MVYCRFMSKFQTKSKKFALLAVAAIALAACGGSSEKSSSEITAASGTGSASTEVVRTKNAALDTQTCATGGTCVIGDTGPGGGKVFYVAPTTFISGAPCGNDCKYLEAAPFGWIVASTPAGQTNCAIAGTSVVDPRCEWSGNTSTAVGTAAQGTAIGAGYANTKYIISQNNSEGKAGAVARAFQGGGKTDWYLPSKDELSQLYMQKAIVGGISSAWYSSSSEIAAGTVWLQDFRNGNQSSKTKQDTPFVRSVRAFSSSTPPTTVPATTTTVARTCAAGGTCAVGDIGPGGGKVFYVASATFTSGAPCRTACKYLEAAPVGWVVIQSVANCAVLGSGTSDPGCQWSRVTQTEIGTTARGTAIGTGYANTSAMVAQSGSQSSSPGKAGTVARSFQGGGKTDWFLPSKDELAQMYSQRGVVGGTSGNYWSSSEYASNVAWFLDFSNGSENRGGRKSDTYYVRPVRAFTSVPAGPAPFTLVPLACADGGACAVGNTGPGGGIVFYVAPSTFTSGAPCGNACKYLEVAPTGWSYRSLSNCQTEGTKTVDPRCEWSGNTSTGIGRWARETAIGSGWANTSEMVLQSSSVGKAGTVARAFQGGGKTDWSLPSQDELAQIYIQKEVIGGITSGAYWSSSEADASRSRYQDFSNGYQGYAMKQDTPFVRPVRAF